LSSCPNSDEPLVYYCGACESEINEGDDCWETHNGDYICEDCGDDEKLMVAVGCTAVVV